MVRARHHHHTAKCLHRREDTFVLRGYYNAIQMYRSFSVLVDVLHHRLAQNIRQRLGRQAQWTYSAPESHPILSYRAPPSLFDWNVFPNFVQAQAVIRGPFGQPTAQLISLPQALLRGRQMERSICDSARGQAHPNTPRNGQTHHRFEQRVQGRLVSRRQGLVAVAIASIDRGINSGTKQAMPKGHHPSPPEGRQAASCRRRQTSRSRSACAHLPWD